MQVRRDLQPSEWLVFEATWVTVTRAGFLLFASLRCSPPAVGPRMTALAPAPDLVLPPAWPRRKPATQASKMAPQEASGR